MQKKYEVIRLVKQNAGCHLVMDYVEGQILAEYLRLHPCIEKEQLFSWMRQLVKQLGDLQSVKGVKAYCYVTPFCIIVKKNQELMLLDLNAGSNRHILNQIAGEKIGSCFFPENEAYNDIYSFGKTIQFLLAKTSPSPALTRREENKFKRIISKCLLDNSKKQYQKFSEILFDFPQIKMKKQNRTIKRKMIFIIFVFVVIATIVYMIPAKQVNVELESDEAEEQVAFLDVGLTYFLELEDYQKSKEMFAQERQNLWLAEQYKEIAAYMIGESEKTKEDIETILQSMEEKIEEEPGIKYRRSILRVYAKLDTAYAQKKCIELGQQILTEDSWKEEDLDRTIETEIRGILAKAYEKEGKYQEALQEYEIVNQWIRNEEIYRSMIRAAKETVGREQVLEICKQGIKDNPGAKELRVQYIQIQCQSKETTKEICEAAVKEMISECPELLEDIEFQKLQAECGIKIEGENIWVEK